MDRGADLEVFDRLLREEMTEERIVAMIRALENRALAGDVRAMRMLLTRIYGPAPRRRTAAPKMEDAGRRATYDLRRLNDDDSVELARLLGIALVEDG